MLYEIYSSTNNLCQAHKGKLCYSNGLTLSFNHLILCYYTFRTSRTLMMLSLAYSYVSHSCRYPYTCRTSYSVAVMRLFGSFV